MAYLWRATVNQKSGQLKQARDDVNIAIDLLPQAAGAYLQRAHIEADLGNWKEAIADCDRASKLTGWDTPSMYELRGRMRRHLGNLDGSFKDLNLALTMNPDSPQYLYSRAQTHLAAKAFKEAAFDAERAIALRPEHPQYLKLAAEAYKQLHATGDAERVLRALTLSSPDDFEGHRLLGMHLRASGNLEEAVKEIDKALRLAPEDDKSHAYRGTLHFDENEFELAAQEFTRALDLNPKYRTVLSRRACCWLQLGQYRRAIAEFESALMFDERDVCALQGMAICLAVADDVTLLDGKRAVALARRAGELSKWSDDATKRTLAMALAECGDYAGALEIVESIPDNLAPAEIASRKELARQFKQGLPYRASNELKKAPDKN